MSISVFIITLGIYCLQYMLQYICLYKNVEVQLNVLLGYCSKTPFIYYLLLNHTTTQHRSDFIAVDAEK